MIWRDIEFHNVDHIREVEGMGGVRLERFPEGFREQLGRNFNQNGRFRCSRVHGCELRFVTDALFFDVGLTALEQDIDIMIYCGDMMHSKQVLKAGAIRVLHIERPEIFDIVDETNLTKVRFAPNVWRIQIGMNGYLHFNYLDTFGCGHRFPRESEKPELTWAAYGSSITCGSHATEYSNAYINQAAVHLGLDVMNKGLSGSCFCENIAADYLASLPVDILSLELGINMAPTFTKEEFSTCIDYLLEKLKAESKAKHIFLIGIYLNKGFIMKDESVAYYQNVRSFTKILEDKVEKLTSGSGAEHFHYINSQDIVKGYHYLSVDLLHPSNEGHIMMGRNLADCMLEFIKE